MEKICSYSLGSPRGMTWLDRFCEVYTLSLFAWHSVPVEILSDMITQRNKYLGYLSSTTIWYENNFYVLHSYTECSERRNLINEDYCEQI